MLLKKSIYSTLRFMAIVLIAGGLTQAGFSQHRGDNLSFQGFSVSQDVSPRALGMGGAYTAASGDINSLFFNPAGLADIGELQVSIAANSASKTWRENQDYRPNRIYWTLPFYLEGLYTPDPANNGRWDYEFAQDSGYVVKYPKLGNEPFSEEAADWQRTQSQSGLNNISLAYPLEFSDQKFVVSGAYNAKFDPSDYDRNQTYLDPHIGFDAYGVVERVETDTVRFDWYDFLRQREGNLYSLTGAVGYQVTDELNVGVGVSVLSGETDDFQYLNRIGYFEIARDNRFRFSYDTLDVYWKGKSTFTARSINVGLLYKLSNINLGVNIILPQTLERKWKYTERTADANTAVEKNISGTDKFEIPASFSIGTNIRPIENVALAFDYQFTNYSQGKLKLAIPDPMNRKWMDQHIIRFGLEYDPADFLSLRAGYRNIPATFVPDGAAIKDSGPVADSYTFGFSFRLPGYGQIDSAIEYRQNKFYDSYYSNTNYQYESLLNFQAAYTFYLE